MVQRRQALNHKRFTMLARRRLATDPDAPGSVRYADRLSSRLSS